jgi:acyl-CoA thioesterase-1
MMLLVLGRRHFIAWLALVATRGLCAVPARADVPLRILIVGDSMSAEYGLARGSGWVALLEQRLAHERWPATVINASISGDTTAGGRSRLPALLRQHQPTHVVIQLGGNDALRGLPLESTQRNLSDMVKASQDAGARVLLVGIQVPPNYGRSYTERFAATFEAVATERRVPWVPFLLKGVADVPDASKYFQTDRIHPNESAQPRLLDNVWPSLRRLLSP